MTTPGAVATELIRLDIPAQPAFVGVARVVVTSVATTVDGIADERLEDLRIAVSEACTSAVEAHAGDPGDQRIVLRCTFDGESFEVHIEDHRTGAATDAGSGPGDDDGWGLQLIRALVDDVAFTAPVDGAPSAVRLVVRSTGLG